MARRLALALLPGLAIAAAWLHVERPAEWGPALVLVVLAASSVLPRTALSRGVAAVAVLIAGLSIALETSLLEPRAALDELWRGLVTFYEVGLPFDPGRDPDMGSLVLVAVLGLSLAVAQLAALRWLLPAAVIAATGTAWPATLVGGGDDLVYGALALGAVLWLLLLGRRRRRRSLVGGACAAAIVVAAAVGVAGTGAGATEAGFNWKRWDLFEDRTARVAVSYVWNANYEGISFPTTRTEVLRVRADRRSRYWRASTLDDFVGGRWVEDLQTQGVGVVNGRGTVRLDELTPRAAGMQAAWLRAARPDRRPQGRQAGRRGPRRRL